MPVILQLAKDNHCALSDTLIRPRPPFPLLDCIVRRLLFALGTLALVLNCHCGTGRQSPGSLVLYLDCLECVCPFASVGDPQIHQFASPDWFLPWS